MRLWHYKLIPVLPNKMLVSQWRECIAIKRQWEKGTLKHSLVKYIMNYDKSYFMTYVDKVCDEMYKRGIKFQDKYLCEIIDFCNDKNSISHYMEHNDRYLIQCYYNLQEKYDRGMITDEEYSKIQDIVLKKLGGVI